MISDIYRNINSKIRKINLKYNKITNEGAWRLATRTYEKNRSA
jgi:hypothetical protein